MRMLWQRIGLVGLGCGLGLGLAELGLQVGSLVVWWQASGDEAADATGDARVLCVGDSFTYGVGAGREDSYPAQLQQVLDEEGGGDRWSVINAGFPGRNSAELLQRLPALLREHDPQYVCVLVGTNDQWSRSEWELAIPALDAEGPEDGWQLRFRLGRLVQVVRPELEQRWRWYTRDRDAKRQRSEAAAEVWQKLDELARRVNQGEDLLRIRDELDRLEACVREDADDRTLDLFFGLLVRCCTPEEIIPRVEATIEEVGPRANLACVMARSLSDAGRDEEAEEWVVRAREAAVLKGERAAAERTRFLLCLRRRDYEQCIAAARAVLTITEEPRDAGNLLRKVAMRADGVPALQADRESLDEEGREDPGSIWRILIDNALRAAVPGTGDPTSPPHPSLDDTELSRELIENLRAVFRLIEEAGALPLCQTYPRDHPHRVVDRLLARAATDAQVCLLDHSTVLGPLLRVEGRRAYLSADGHCNARGYLVMAMNVAERLLQLNQARPRATTGD